VLPARERAGNRIDPHPMAKEKKRGQQPPKDRFAPAISTRPSRMFNARALPVEQTFFPKMMQTFRSAGFPTGCQASAIRRPKDRIGTCQT
jgi:hypothetical protein